MTLSRALCGTLILATAAACGGTPEGPINPSPGVLQVGGQYQVTQQAATDTCGQTGQPVPVTATVTHSPGASPFTLNDTGGTRFTGTVQNNGDFTANAVLESGGQTFTQQLQGRFTASGFTAGLSVRVTPQNCDFTRNWTAAKQGSPNIFP